MRTIRRSPPYPIARNPRIDDYSSGPEDYEILQQIGQGKSSIVYLAICRRGRLRNRQVALKKIPLSTTFSTTAPIRLATSTRLHQALHHPRIVSLLSTFATPSAHFHILELCSRGTLSAFLQARDPPILSEGELRGVLKSLIDALLYLKKELIVHRDITPSNILLTNDYTIKLSDFDLATPLSAVNSVTICSSPNYVAPEIVSGLPSGFAADIWSLGCIALTCLSGRPPFEADVVSDVLKNISQATYILPEGISFEARDLIVGLLQIDPGQRLQLSRIMAHPFFNPILPVTPLCPTPPIGISNRHKTSGSFQTIPAPTRLRPPCLPAFPLKPTISRRGRHSDIPLPRRGSGHVLEDIGNKDLRNILYDEIPSKVKTPTMSSTRRIVSDPLPRPLGPLASELAILTSGQNSSLIAPSLLESDSPPPSNGPFDANEPEPFTGWLKCKRSLTETNLRPTEQTKLSRHGREIPDAACTKGFEKATLLPAARHDNISSQRRGDQVSERLGLPDAVPIGTTRPSPLTTSLLNPRTHKATHGQVTVLPSRSLLIDFREGERRRGQKGDEVLVLDPEGTQIKVYSAPHLSTPCCLAEPLCLFTIETLPSAYWKQYNDASRIIEQIKQRTPRLVIYKPEARYTLMAGSPLGDMELLFQSSAALQQQNSHGGPESTDFNRQTPRMRLRLSRQHHSVEIARYIRGTHGGEWTKKVLHVDKSLAISDRDWNGLELPEREGMCCLADFLRTCKEVERLDEEGPGLPVICSSIAGSRPSHGRSPGKEPAAMSTLQTAHTRQPSAENHGSSSATIARSLGSIHVAPRPPKLRALTDSGQFGVTDEQTFLFSAGKYKSASCQGDPDLTTEGHGIQTRFIASVGWCIRYGSRVSQGGRYRILFLDGVSMDIDVDEEWLELKSRSGHVVRHNIRDSNSTKKIGDRMKVFEEFVSMFDDGH